MQRREVVVDGERMVGWRAGYGAGMPVVCVHGAGVSSRELRPLVAALGGAVRAWTVDLPGFGQSGKPSRPLELVGLADALAGWMAAERISGACLVGCSFGCQLAVDVAVRHPELAGALVLAGPTVDAAARSWPKLVWRWARNSVREDPRMAPLNIADYRDAGMRRVLSSFATAMRDGMEDKLPYVGVPTLVVRGEYDRLVPREWAEEVTRRLPRGRLVVLPGLPHMIPFKDPGALVPLIVQLVRDGVPVVRHG
ncbi:alpha/beta hydrolase [Spongiactinospora gelatinilytica]|uniref:Alpha/beta hydrolase n=1 Tax=Spongiactinospora gelatinilytica TaxID=2666298 RepID=A0A2W2FVQ0_9ACTN|nr:alpha/beta fold hydrolase [Spongiactinospora gelatinilytica]PZG39722.1 alpha/beta hydrolase [Spongiactinospora gelatinilytica]